MFSLRSQAFAATLRAMNERIELQDKNAPVTGTQNRDRCRGELAASSSDRGVATGTGKCAGDAAGELRTDAARSLGDLAAEIVRRLEFARVKSHE